MALESAFAGDVRPAPSLALAGDPPRRRAHRRVLRGTFPPNPLRSLRPLRSRADRRSGARCARAARRSRPDRASREPAIAPAARGRNSPVGVSPEHFHAILETVLPSRRRKRHPPDPLAQIGPGRRPGGRHVQNRRRPGARVSRHSLPRHARGSSSNAGAANSLAAFGRRSATWATPLRSTNAR